jgi:hypothetical protein
MLARIFIKFHFSLNIFPFFVILVDAAFFKIFIFGFTSNFVVNFLIHFADKWIDRSKEDD